MKIALASDLHIEHKSIVLENKHNAKVLVLAGDICVSEDLRPYDDESMDFRSQRIHELFIDVCHKFEYVIYVMGNHESYYGDFQDTATNLKKQLSYITNLHLLDKEYITIEDVTFVGCTLWSDMNNEDPKTIEYIKNAMTDFRIITNSKNIVQFKAMDQLTNRVVTKTKPAKFTPLDAIEEFDTSVEFIASVVDVDPKGKFVVVTHHAPSLDTIQKEFKNDILMNGGYSSDLNKFIIDRPQIKCWLFGHQHQHNSFKIGETILRIQARGYPGEIPREYGLQYFNV
jgi:Icc-related predicted phosphoesterase